MAVGIGVWLKTKDKKLKGNTIGAWFSAMFGVTEPVMYGVVLPNPKFFVIANIFSGLAGAWIGFSKLNVYQMSGIGGIFAIPGYFSNHYSITYALANAGIAIAISVIPTAAITYFMYKDKTVDSKVGQANSQLSQEANGSGLDLVAPLKGKVMALSQVPDEAFSLGILGKGIAIDPSEGTLVAPCDGQITTLFPTLHAIGIKADNGAEILIHVGMDTVQLNGEGFHNYVKQGDTVTKGQPLLEIDLEFIKSKGFSTVTPIVITNSKDFAAIKETEANEVLANDALLMVGT